MRIKRSIFLARLLNVYLRTSLWASDLDGLLGVISDLHIVLLSGRVAPADEVGPGRGVPIGVQDEMGRVDVLDSVDEGAELDIRNQMGDNAVRMNRAVDEVGGAVAVVVVDL